MIMVEYRVYHLGYISARGSRKTSFNVIDYYLQSFNDIFEAEKFVQSLIDNGDYEEYELAIYPRYIL